MSNNVYVVNETSALKPTGGAGQELNVGASVVQFAPFSNVCGVVMVSVKSTAILATFDGTNPASAGAGVYMPAAAQPYVLSRLTAQKMRMIEAAGGSAAVARAEEFV
jgi:hypothetical protein